MKIKRRGAFGKRLCFHSHRLGSLNITSPADWYHPDTLTPDPTLPPKGLPDCDART